MKRKGIIIGAAAVLAAGLMLFAVLKLSSAERKLDIPERAEAGRNVSVAEIVKVKDKYSDRYTLTPKTEKMDLIPPKADIEYVLRKNDGSEKNVTITLDVEDTTAPEIKAVKTSVLKGSKTDIYSLIDVTDSLDGTIGKDKIAISGKIHTEKSGNYKVKITASDNAGNIAEKEITFSVTNSASKVSQAQIDAFMKDVTGVWMKNCSTKAEMKKRIIPGIDAEELGCIIFTQKNGKYYINDFELLGPEDDALDFTKADKNTMSASFKNSNFGKLTITIKKGSSSDVITVTLRNKTFKCYYTGAKTVDQYNKKYK